MLCTWLLSLFHWGTYSVHVVVQVWWKCQCVSVSVEVSVFKGFSGRTLRNAFGKNGGFPWFLLCGKEKIVNSCIGRFFNINCLTYPQHRPNIASKMAQRGANIGQHGANIRQHRPNLGQHKPNIGQPRPNIGSTWAEDVPNIGHMGPTWPNLGPRCAPDSLTTLFNIIGPTKSQKERERERDRTQPYGTWPNLGPRCAPDSLTLLNIGERERERERERQDPALHRPKWAGARLSGISLMIRAPATGPCPGRRPSVGYRRLFKDLRPTAQAKGRWQGKRARGLGAAGGRRGGRRGGGWGPGNGQRAGRRSRGTGR